MGRLLTAVGEIVASELAISVGVNEALSLIFVGVGLFVGVSARVDPDVTLGDGADWDSFPPFPVGETCTPVGLASGFKVGVGVGVFVGFVCD